MKPLFTTLALSVLFSISGICQIQNFYNYVDQNLEGYDSAGFFFVKKPNTIPPAAFFDIYALASGDVDNDILLKKTWVDNQLGMTHYRYQQTYKGVPVEVGEATEHYNGSELDYVNGKLVYNLNRSVTPDITANQAISTVQQYFNPTFDGGSNDSSSNEAANIQIAGTPELLLAIDNYDNLSVYIDGARYTLAWKIIAVDTISDYNGVLFVNANTGVIFREDELNHYGYADIWYHGNQFIDTEWSGAFLNRYRLKADDNGRNFETRENNKTKPPHNQGNDNWGTNYHDQTVAHWGIMKSWDYFGSKFNRTGMDGSGGTANSLIIFVGGTGNNAYYTPPLANTPHDIIRFSIDKGQYYNRAIDVVGHEYTHGVTHYTANLNGYFEPGALNESFSDIFGTMIEAYAEGGLTDWFLGEDPNLSWLRSMSQPKSFGSHYDLINGNYVQAIGQPNTYVGQYWFSGPQNVDRGGVHINDGVQNYWFYLLANSGSGLNDNNDSYVVNGIGITDAAEIAYYNLTSNLQSGAQFADARAGSIKFAENKWGICSNQAIQTANAWHAVGVGAKSTCNVTSVPKIIPENIVNIYPNPSNGIFTISVNQNTIQSVKVLTIGGKKVYFDLNLPSKNQHQFDLSFLPNGFYFVEVEMNDYISRKRIIISK